MTRHFEKWARKERIGNADLGAVIQAADAGLIHANLKGCLVNIRLARQGAGKSSGYRTIIAYKKDERAFFFTASAKEIAQTYLQTRSMAWKNTEKS